MYQTFANGIAQVNRLIGQSQEAIGQAEALRNAYYGALLFLAVALVICLFFSMKSVAVANAEVSYLRGRFDEQEEQKAARQAAVYPVAISCDR